MRTIWSLWQDALAENRSNPAYLVEEDGGWREVSQQEAATAVTELAHGLLALGVEKGDSFGILARTRLEWVLLDFALAQIGAVAAPIYPSSTASEACYILEHANVVGCLVEDDEQLAKIEAARPEHVYTLETLDELRALGREHASAHPDALDEARAPDRRRRPLHVHLHVRDDRPAEGLHDPQPQLLRDGRNGSTRSRTSSSRATSCSSTCRSHTTSGGSCTCWARTSATRSRSCRTLAESAR